MGISTNAILAYGFDLGEELPDSLMTADQDYFNFDEWHRAVMFSEPEPDYDTQYEDWKAWDARAQTALRAYPVDIITHCSDSYPMYFLCIRGTNVTAYRGDSTPIDKGFVVPDVDEKLAAIEAFCKEHGIEPQSIGWHLFSYYG